MTFLVCPNCGTKLKYWETSARRYGAVHKDDVSKELLVVGEEYKDVIDSGYVCTFCKWAVNIDGQYEDYSVIVE